MAGNEKRGHVASTLTSVLALFVSLASLGFTLYWNSPVGDVRPISPTRYGIMRGIKTEIEGTSERFVEVPSDHIVLPLTWQNSSGTSVLVKEPKLVVQELDKAPEDGGVLTGKPYYLLLTGEYSEVTSEVFAKRNNEPFSYKGSLVLEPHSVSQSMLVFRVMKWETDNYNFHLEGDKHYRIDITYEQIPTIEIRRIPKGLHWSFTHIAGTSTKTTRLVPDLHTYKEVDCLQPYGEAVEPNAINDNCLAHKAYKDEDKQVPPGYGWDYRSLVPGARN